ncbi:proteasome regulatory particle base subunit [Crenichthys baileyi]|uniref:Dolichyl-diphosphooligosaccharide--protein glycosyltransferase subunit 1 n=1 Tax=Crenichthys baileyi TaxID=28760 RepID=A0AAV9QYZ4_9TELE
MVLRDPAAEVRMKVASITEQLLTLVNKRLGLYRHMDEVVNRYKQSRDTGALNSGRKTLEADHRSLTNEISSLQARLKTEGSDLAEKGWGDRKGRQGRSLCAFLPEAGAVGR